MIIDSLILWTIALGGVWLLVTSVDDLMYCRKLRSMHAVDSKNNHSDRSRDRSAKEKTNQ